MPADPARARALAGASVVITRPAETAEPLVRGVRSRGGHPVRLPGMRLAPVDDVPAVRQALLAAAAYPLWIFTSPAAVRHFAELAPARVPSSDARVFAVGAGTARALARIGLAATAPARQHDSDGLLAEAQLADVRGRSVAIIDAPDGSDRLAPTLRERGARVERIHVYRRQPPLLAAGHLQRLGSAERPWISLVSSGLALDQLLSALPEDLIARWQGEALVVSSPRLAAQARTAGFADIHVARSALTADLLDCACSVLAHHRL